METLYKTLTDSYYDRSEDLSRYKTTAKSKQTVDKSSPYFSVDYDAEQFEATVAQYGIKEARRILGSIYAKNFETQNWEATHSDKPLEFKYFIRELDGQRLLVHQSDGELNPEKDILKGTNRILRNGLEYEQTSIMRQMLLDGENGASVVSISPKKLNGEVSCPYPETFVTIAEKKGDVVEVRQFQSMNMDLRGSARFLNQLLNLEILDERASLDEVMRSVIKTPGRFSNGEIQMLIQNITGEGRDRIADVDPKVFSKVSERYMEILQKGVSGAELNSAHKRLLLETLGEKEREEAAKNGFIDTSCGRLDVGGNNNAIPSWCEVTSSGEIKCKFCRERLKRSDVENHRCIC